MRVAGFLAKIMQDSTAQGIEQKHSTAIGTGGGEGNRHGGRYTTHTEMCKNCTLHTLQFLRYVCNYCAVCVGFMTDCVEIKVKKWEVAEMPPLIVFLHKLSKGLYSAVCAA